VKKEQENITLQPNIYRKENKQHRIPSIIDVDAQATTWATLKDEDREFYRTLRDDYKKKKIEYQRRERCLHQMNMTILNSVDTDLWIVICDVETPYQKLLALQTHMAPSTRGREQQIRQEHLSSVNQRITNVLKRSNSAESSGQDRRRTDMSLRSSINNPTILPRASSSSSRLGEIVLEPPRFRTA
jgi:hypothetical protein